MSAVRLLGTVGIVLFACLDASLLGQRDAPFHMASTPVRFFTQIMQFLHSVLANWLQQPIASLFCLVFHHYQ